MKNVKNWKQILLSIMATFTICWGGVFVSCSDDDVEIEEFVDGTDIVGDITKTLSSISVDTTTAKTTFATGTKFDTTNLIVTPHFSNKTTGADARSQATYSYKPISGGEAVELTSGTTKITADTGTYDVTVTYKWTDYYKKEWTATTTYPIEVTDIFAEAKDVTITAEDDKIEKDAAFTYTKVKVTGKIDGEETDLTTYVDLSFTFKNGENEVTEANMMATAGTYTVTVSIDNAPSVESASYKLIVKGVASIALATDSNLYSYTSDNSTYYVLGKISASITVTYTDNDTTTVPATSATFSNVASTSATMTYAGKDASVTLTAKNVSELVEAGVAVSELVEAGVAVSELVANCTDYTVGDADCSKSWVPGSEYKIAAGETQTVYFANYGSGGANWNNFLIEMWNAAATPAGITMRADNYGWNYGDESESREFSYAKVDTTGLSLPSDWATWLTAINGAVVKLEVSYTSEKTITFTATSDAVENWKQVYSFTGCTSDSLSWHFNVDGSYLVILK